MKTLVSLLVAGAVGLVAAGEPVVAAAQWQTANSTATGDQDSVAMAANRNGHLAVVWEDDRDAENSGDNNHSEIYLRLFRHAAPVYEVKLSAAGTAGANWRHLSPDVGLDDKGNAVVVWADDPDANGFYNIAYRVVNTAGTVTASGHANASGDGQQINPKVAVDPDGGAAAGAPVAFTVVWEDIQGTNPATVKAAGFTNPTTRAYEVTASPSTGVHHRPDVAVSAAGDAWIVWEHDSDVGLVKISKPGTVGTRTTASANTGGAQTRPSIEATFNGEFAVAWISNHTGTPGVWARSFKAAGPSHAEVEVAAGGTDPRVGVDEQGGVVVVWTVGGVDTDVYAWRVRLAVSWGVVEVPGVGKFKDAKVFPDQVTDRVTEWDWAEHGTRHSPGIQPADVRDLVEAGAEVIVLSRGMQLRLEVMPETLSYLESAGVLVHVEETTAAVERYDLLSTQRPTGALIHSTC